ncbi:MAG: hypothetical protein DWQ04_15950 [Chloroflexi bacterium]|nr:MAG: hypothetical protein DWQ04_15950 [Chloroflexota bacterium]
MKRWISWPTLFVSLLVGIILGAGEAEWVMNNWQVQRVELPTSTYPTETAPTFVLDITITDATAGKPVLADVFLGQSPDIDVEAPGDAMQLMCEEVSMCEVMMTGTAVSQATNVQVVAPGYEKFSIVIRPHVVRSKRLKMPIKLIPADKKL